MGVPRVKVFEIDGSHLMYLRSDFCEWAIRTELAEIGSGAKLWDNLSQSSEHKMRLRGKETRKRMK